MARRQLWLLLVNLSFSAFLLGCEWSLSEELRVGAAASGGGQSPQRVYEQAGASEDACTGRILPLLTVLVVRSRDWPQE
jgi:hypothetical protein